MTPRTEHLACSGLVVPVLTVLDEKGALIESDQRALVRYVIQGGDGADVVYAASAMGERDRLGADVWRSLVRVCLEEVQKGSAALPPRRSAIKTWVGVTASTREQTLDHLAFAIECGANAVVLAPHAIRALEDPVRFIERDVADALDAMGHRAKGVSLYLDDERDASVPSNAYIRTRLVRSLSRLDFVRGVAATGRRRRLGNDAQARASSREADAFGVYAGEPQQIFDLFCKRRGFLGSLTRSWTRRRLGGALPSGVMAASANAFPREWASAWQVCRVGDAKHIEPYRELLETFRVRTHEAGGRRTIACYKRALQMRGVISSAAVAEGTPALRYPDVDRFDRAFEDAQSRAEEQLGALNTSSGEPR